MPKKITIETLRKQGKSADLSFGGAKIHGEIVGAVGDIVRCEIFGRGKDDLIIVMAQIMWCKTVPNNFEFGVRFIGLKDEEIEILEDMMHV